MVFGDFTVARSFEDSQILVIRYFPAVAGEVEGCGDDVFDCVEARTDQTHP